MNLSGDSSSPLNVGGSAMAWFSKFIEFNVGKEKTLSGNVSAAILVRLVILSRNVVLTNSMCRDRNIYGNAQRIL